MPDITLISVELAGFKCFKQPTALDFPGKPGFYFLGGRNEVEPRLGANGTGKSSLWDAICWCLYGTGVKGAKASELASWGVKRPEVAVILDIDGQIWTIRRQGSPEKIEVQNFHHAPDPYTQHEVDQLLGLTKQRFLQSVLFGQGAKLFFDLSVPDRGALLDEVLDLGLWAALADKAKGHSREYEKLKADAIHQLTYMSGQLEGLADVAFLEQQEAAWKAEQEAEALRLLDGIEAAEGQVQALYAKADAIAVGPFQASRGLLEEIEAVRATIEKDRSARQDAFRNLQQAEELLAFYDEHKDCPTCKQNLSHAFVKNKVAEHKEEQRTYSQMVREFDKDIDAFRSTLADLEAVLEKERELHRWNLSQREALAPQIALLERGIKADFAQVERLSAGLDKSPYAAQIATVTERRAELEKDMAAYVTKRDGYDAKLRHYDYWQQGFKKLRLFIIKQALTMLELETKAAAAQLGLIDWSIQYVTEVETKSGSLKAGVQILVKSPGAPGAFSLQSGGEEQRVKLAISLGMANMIQRMAGTFVNFEVWDEPTAWLSPEGISDLMESLRYRADSTGKQLWVVDHRAFDTTTFDGLWYMIKTTHGTQLEVK